MNKISPHEGFVTIGDNEKVVSLSEFKSLGISESMEMDGVPVTKFTKSITPTIEKAEGGDDNRTIKTVISDGRLDRDNDTISVEGWDISDYSKNPVVLWAHSNQTPPIARSEIEAQKKRLVSYDTFAQKEDYEFADTVFRLVKGGFINAKSVGFLPTELDWDEERWGFDIAKQSLLEHSWVPVPSNPRALVLARSKGVDVQPVVNWAERVLDEWTEVKGIYVPRENLEAVATSLGQKAGVSFFMFDVDKIKEAVGMKKDEVTEVPETPEVEKDTTEPELITMEGEGERAFTQETKDYLQMVIALKELETELVEKGFDEEEIAEILAKVKTSEGIKSVEKTEVDVEVDEIEIDLDRVKEILTDKVEGIKEALVEVTGRVH